MRQQASITDFEQEWPDFTVAHQSARLPQCSPDTPSNPLAYSRKFSDLLFLLRVSTEEVIIVHHPNALGDNYEELVESLNRLGDAGKKLVIVPRNERT